MIQMLHALALSYLVTAAKAVPQGIPTTPGSPSLPTGFKDVLFYDDFSKTTDGYLPASEDWTIDLGTAYPGGPAQWGTSEIQTYTKDRSNIAISNGTLRITPQLSGTRWSSARIELKKNRDFSCGPGKKTRVEARIRLGAAAASSQAGIWPAFWTLGAAFRGNYQNWPHIGEIDIMESVNGNATAHHTVHCGNGKPGPGPCNEPTGIGSSSSMRRGEWHTWAVELDRTLPGGRWQNETITWFVDGKVAGTALTGTRVADEKAWQSLVHEPRFVLLNVAVGGSFPDAIARRRTPDSGTKGGDGAMMEVDHVGIYST